MPTSSATFTDPHERLIMGLQALGPVSARVEAVARELPMHVHAVAPHHNVAVEGDRLSECCVVIEGCFIRHKIMSSGQRQILSFHFPGDFPDLESLHRPFLDYSIGALTEGRVAYVPHAALRDAIGRAHELSDMLWRATLRDASIFRTWLASVGRRPAYQRLAHLFCELFVRMKTLGIATETGFALPITQMELADALGLSTVHLNRTLQQLRRDGLIVTDGKFFGFTDWDRLRKAADFDAAYLSPQ